MMNIIKERTMLLLCYPRCSTCKKAQKWLDEKKINYRYRDIKEDNPSAEELGVWLRKSGLEIKRFFNTSGQLYKSMGLKDRLPSMTDEEKLSLLSTDGMLVKRPLLIGDDYVLVGFREQEWTEKLV